MSRRRESNSRSSPYQGDVLPLNYSGIARHSLGDDGQKIGNKGQPRQFLLHPQAKSLGSIFR